MLCVPILFLVSIAAGKPAEEGTRFKRNADLQQLHELLEKEQQAVGSIKCQVATHFIEQNAEWERHSPQIAKLNQQITQNYEAAKQSRGPVAEKADEFKAKYDQEREKFQQTEQQNSQEKDKILEKIQALEFQVKDLDAKNKDLEGRKGSMSEAEYKKDQQQFAEEQERINGELRAQLGKGKKLEQAVYFVADKMDKWKNGWSANPVVGNPSVAGGPDNGGVAPGSNNVIGAGTINFLDPKEWEKYHDAMWGNFESYQAKWQNWVNDPNAGNYNLANEKWGAFDNGDFNVVKFSEEFFGPGHVKNDELRGNYTTNAGFGVVGAVTGDSGAGRRRRGATGSVLGAVVVACGDGALAGGSPPPSPGSGKYNRGDTFWDGMAEYWRREVGPFFDAMIAKYKSRNAELIGFSGSRSGIDVNADDSTLGKKKTY